MKHLTILDWWGGAGGGRRLANAKTWVGTGYTGFNEKGALCAFVYKTYKLKAAKKKPVTNVDRAGSIFIKKMLTYFLLSNMILIQT